MEEERSNPASLPLDWPSTNGSFRSPVIGEYDNGNLPHGMLQNEEKIPSLINDLHTPTPQQREPVKSGNESAIELEGTDIESSNAHTILARHSHSESEENEKENGVPISVKRDDANQVIVERTNNGNLQYRMLQNDEKVPSLQQRGSVDLENESAVELDDKITESTKEIETQNGVLKSGKKDEANRVIVDTEAPFESVKEAVTKFGGSADWKAQREQFVERRNYVQLELKKVQEEIRAYREQCEVSEVVRGRVLMELDNTKRLLEELRLGLEKAEAQEAEAKLDSELADLRLKEMEQGINSDASVAAKTQLEVARERHASAIAELKLVKQELESMKREHASLVQERDVTTRKAEESVSASKEMEKTVEDLTVELATIKDLLESAHSAHLEAEERRVVTVLAFDQDKLNSEKELKGAAGEIQRLNEQLLLTDDLQSRLDRSSTLLVNVKAELSSYIEAKKNPDVNNTQELKPADQARELEQAETNTPAALAAATKELEEARANIEKANEEVNCLRVAVSSLKSELEMEKTSMATLRQKENLASISASSLEAEINRINTELELIMTRQKKAIEKMDLARKLQEAAAEADQAKDRASTIETRLNAARKEIEAARASEKSAKSAVREMEESEQASVEPEASSNLVTLPIEEYYRLSRKATEAEEIANKIMFSSIEQIKLAKSSESRSLVKLEETNKMIEEKKRAQTAALKKAEKAMEAKLGVEQELRSRRAAQEQQRKIRNGCRSVSDSSNLDDARASEKTVTEAGATDEGSAGSWKQCVPRSNTNTNKRSYLPRIVKFLARKKVQALFGAALFLLFCCDKKYMPHPKRASTESQPTHNPRRAAI